LKTSDDLFCSGTRLLSEKVRNAVLPRPNPLEKIMTLFHFYHLVGPNYTVSSLPIITPLLIRVLVSIFTPKNIFFILLFLFLFLILLGRHKHAYTSIHTHMHTHKHTLKHARAHTQTCTCMRVSIIFTCIFYIYIFTHTPDTH